VKISRFAWLLLAIIAGGLAMFMYSYAGGKTSKHSVTLRWSPTPGASSYYIYRGTASGGPYTRIGVTHDPPYVDKPVPSGSTFYYVVTTIRDGKESPHSAEIKASVP
jgi:fibronectin type 3 domain-containing protein